MRGSIGLKEINLVPCFKTSLSFQEANATYESSRYRRQHFLNLFGPLAPPSPQYTISISLSQQSVEHSLGNACQTQQILLYYLPPKEESDK